jgi:surface antigen
LNGVVVYYNGGIGHVSKRNVSEDGYNIGLKYQCVEFIKRYYYEHYDHKMPNSYGNAKDFFNRKIKDGEINSDRALYQFTNPSKFKPRPGEILVLGGTAHNRYGHVVIISEVGENEIEIIQQNPGPFGESRVRHPLVFENGMWRIENDRVLGRLGKERNKLILRK